jgi:hypothetical protein
VVTGLTPSFTDDHLEIQRVALGNEADLDHVDLLGQFEGIWRLIYG